MKYIITERQQKLFEDSPNITKFDEYVANKIWEEYPQLKNSLIKKKIVSHHNTGYGSGLHDYQSFRIEYNDDDGYTWIIKNGEHEKRNGYSHCQFEVNELLETFYNWFGEKALERFFLIYHGIDISEPGGFRYNWGFY